MQDQDCLYSSEESAQSVAHRKKRKAAEKWFRNFEAVMMKKNIAEINGPDC